MKTALTMIAALLLGWAEVALACRVIDSPLEQLFGAWFRGPARTDIASRSEAWAGRTTLASGSASVVVSTSNVKSNSLILPFVEVALPSEYTTRGIISIVSGTGTGVASTTAVFSGQAILIAMQNLTSQPSGYPRGFRVNSIVDGVSFGVATVDSLAPVGTSLIHWNIPEAVPAGIKVNTITEEGYFTLGWADGRPRPRDVTVMWEVRLPGRTSV